MAEDLSGLDAVIEKNLPASHRVPHQGGGPGPLGVLALQRELDNSNQPDIDPVTGPADAQQARDAGVIIYHQDAAQYFQRIFVHDWENLAAAEAAPD